MDATSGVKEYDLYLWDFDGTLVDSHSAVCANMTRAIEGMFGEAVDSERVTKLVTQGLSLEETLQAASDRTYTPDELTSLAKTYRATYSDTAEDIVDVFPGAAQTVESLAAKGKTQVIVTQKTSHLVTPTLKKFQLEAYFPTIFGVTPERPPKPDAALYVKHIAPLFPEVGAERTVMIGDSKSDARFAHNAGLDFAWASWGSHGNTDEQQELATHVLTSPQEIANF